MSARPTLAPRDRRALRMGALVVLPVLAWTLGARPWLASLAATRDVARAERAAYARELALVRGGPASSPTVVDESVRARLYGGAAYAASAALAGDVGRLARASGVTLRESAPGDARPRADGLVELPLDLRGEGGLAEVLGLLRAVEAHERLVQVTRLSIERATAADGGETLAFVAAVRGFAPAGGAR